MHDIVYSPCVSKRTLSVRIDDELWERIAALAARDERTVSQKTHLMLRKVVEQEEGVVIRKLLEEVRNGSND